VSYGSWKDLAKRDASAWSASPLDIVNSSITWAREKPRDIIRSIVDSGKAGRWDVAGAGAVLRLVDAEDAPTRETDVHLQYTQIL